MLRTIIFSGLFLIHLSLSAQSPDTLRLFVADQTLYAGNAYSFPVYSSNFDSIVDFQFTLSLSKDFVDSAGLFSNNLLEMEHHFNWSKERNQLGLLWYNKSGGSEISVPKDSALFSIYLQIKQDITVRDLIKLLYNGMVPPECLNYNSFYNGHPGLGISLNYDPGFSALLLAADNLNITDRELKIFPNPCKSGSLINLETAEQFDSYQWFNLDGKAISDRRTLNNNQLPVPAHLSNGSYFIEFLNSTNKSSKTRIEIIN